MISMGSKSLIAKAVDKLRNNYPSLFIGDGDQWQARSLQYWEKLRKFDLDVVEEACDQATDKHPDKFPSSGQLVKLCIDIQREREKLAYARSQQESLARDARETREAVDLLRAHVIPDDHAGQEAWIAESDDPFEQLARTFEVRSKRMRLDPNETTPPEEAAYRMRALGGLLADSEIKIDPFQKPQPRVPQPDSMREPGEDG